QLLFRTTAPDFLADAGDAVRYHYVERIQELSFAAGLQSGLRAALLPWRRERLCVAPIYPILAEDILLAPLDCSISDEGATYHRPGQRPGSTRTNRTGSAEGATYHTPGQRHWSAGTNRTGSAEYATYYVQVLRQSRAVCGK